jgi:hypothetical protein
MNHEIADAKVYLKEAGFIDYERPWLLHAARHVREDGPFADYAGWLEWMNEKLDKWPAEGWWDDMGECDRALLYGLMSDLPEGGEEGRA